MIEAKDEHDLALFVIPHDHCPEKPVMFTYVEETQAVVYCILADEIAYLIGRGGLKVTAVYVQDFVEETAHVEAQSQSLFRTQGIRIFIFINPSSFRKGEFQLIAIVCNLF